MVKIEIKVGRVKRIADVVRKIGLKRIYVIEEKDPQFIATKILYQNSLNVGYTCLISVANALISYKLSSKGEIYWLKFANYISSLPENFTYILNNIVRFLKETKLNVMMMDQKIRRLQRFLNSTTAKKLYENPEYYAKNLESLRNEIASVLKTNPNLKTIVFSAKIFYYASTGIKPKIPLSIPIPVDSRVTKITITSGILNVKDNIGRSRKTSYLQSKYSYMIRRAWINVSTVSKIPSLNIDSLLWISGKYLSYGFSKQVLAERTIEYLKDLLGERFETVLEEFVKEIFRYY